MKKPIRKKERKKKKIWKKKNKQRDFAIFFENMISHYIKRRTFASKTLTDKADFFRAGGISQLRLENGADLRQAAVLDEKQWCTLALPVVGVFERVNAASITKRRKIH